MPHVRPKMGDLLEGLVNTALRAGLAADAERADIDSAGLAWRHNEAARCWRLVAQHATDIAESWARSAETHAAPPLNLQPSYLEQPRCKPEEMRPSLKWIVHRGGCWHCGSVNHRPDACHLQPPQCGG
jgi:hypothetical protein